MMLPGPLHDGLVVLSRGEADEPKRDLFGPELRTTVRYADPASWVTATALARAFAPLKEAFHSVRHHVGVLMTSDWGPKETMDDVAASALTGFSSPFRYPAANPGALVGVSCIAFGFKGPTLNFIMSPREGVPVELLMAAGWLRRGVVPLALLATCVRRPAGKLLARCMALARQDSSLPAPKVLLSDREANWLAFVSE